MHLFLSFATVRGNLLNWAELLISLLHSEFMTQATCASGDANNLSFMFLIESASRRLNAGTV